MRYTCGRLSQYREPSAPSAPSVNRAGYAFLGYYTADGKQIYGENLNCVYSVWPYVEKVTLYAHWVRLSNVTFMSDGNQVGSVATAQQGKALPAAPTGATKAGYGFLGYFTEATGGTMVYDGKEGFFKSPNEALNNGISMIHQEIRQVQATGLNCYRYGFISRSGFRCEPEENMIFIHLDKLYS